MDAAGSGGADLRVAKSLLAWITAQFTIAARRTGKPAGARLLRMTAEKLAAVMQRCRTCKRFVKNRPRVRCSRNGSCLNYSRRGTGN